VYIGDQCITLHTKDETMKFKPDDKVKIIASDHGALFPIGMIGTVTEIHGYHADVANEAGETFSYMQYELELHIDVPRESNHPTTNFDDFKVPEESRRKMFAAHGMKSLIKRIKRSQQVVGRVSRMMGV